MLEENIQKKITIKITNQGTVEVEAKGFVNLLEVQAVLDVASGKIQDELIKTTGLIMKPGDFGPRRMG